MRSGTIHPQTAFRYPQMYRFPPVNTIPDRLPFDVVLQLIINVKALFTNFGPMNGCYRFFLSLAGWFFVLSLPVQSQSVDPPFLTPDASRWADSVLQTMSYEQRIGQLFMVDAYSNRDSQHVATIAGMIREFHIGGIIFFQGGPVRQANLNNYFQSLSKVPLMVGIDGEWGLSMRLDSTVRFPRQMTLSAGGSDSLVYEVAREIGKHCHRMGIHVNFAPVADVNNNVQNPVINTRSFGDDPAQTASRSLRFMEGLQDEKVMACVKHFPGHGDTDADSHLALPMISRSRAQLDSIELVPFYRLVDAGVASAMVAHLFVPALDPGLATSLSEPVVTGLLKKEMGFRGLIFTDALNMKGVADFYSPGEIAVKAIQAGNDILLFSADVPSAFWRIHYALQNCELYQEDIDYRVKKILMAKYWSGLNNYQPVDTTHLIEDLNSPAAQSLTRTAYEKAITVLSNKNSVLPLRNVRPGTVVSLVIGDTINNAFQQTIRRYTDAVTIAVPRDFSMVMADSLVTLLSGYETVIVSIHNIMTKGALRYGIPDTIPAFLDSLSKRVKLVTVVFGNSYSLSRLSAALRSEVLIMSYEDTYWPQVNTAQLLFAGGGGGGELPVAVDKDFTKGSGIPGTLPGTRLLFTTPPVNVYGGIDSLAIKAIRNKATPGCQVLVAKNGKVVYQKSFGAFTYDSTRMVSNDDLYDIASITKIAATALATMKLVESKKIDITKKASYYLPELKKSNKKNLVISDILTHQAGLKAWIPFWKVTMENGKPAYNIYHPQKDVNYTIRVTDSLYMLNLQKDLVWKELVASDVDKPGKYVYSDLGMLIMQRIIEHITGSTLDAYLEKEFYEPMGLYRLGFNPLDHYKPELLPPTEFDTAFRKQLIQGTVHDPAAAMMGGVAGNAGLFSDASSLAAVMQLLLNGGEYGGTRYLQKSTVDLFTTRFHKNGSNRRGLIFDKPETAPGKESPAARSASPATYGHTGFTGTCAWADPTSGLVFIFLSNRVYPDAGNTKLVKENIRTDMMEEVYKVLNK
jgi:beta-N-acetylhexosaminidase